MKNQSESFGFFVPSVWPNLFEPKSEEQKKKSCNDWFFILKTFEPGLSDEGANSRSYSWQSFLGQGYGR
jgi:hypothetical protein